MHRYPRWAAAIASPTPVLPEVGSTIVPPGRRSPSRSAASIIARPMRSLLEPPGFMYSSFASSVAPVSRPNEASRTIGVWPTRSRTVGYSRATRRKPIGGAPGRGKPATPISVDPDGVRCRRWEPRAMHEEAHRPLCTIELIAEGHAERCPGEECAFWERGCALARVEGQLGGRPEVARVLLDLRREIESGRAVAVEEAHTRLSHILNVDEGIEPIEQ